MAQRHDQDESRSRRHYEVYLTRRNPGEPGDEISEAEWREFVARHEDLHPTDPADHDGKQPWQQTWKFHSHPEGTPLFYGDGAIYIVRDDEATIERLVELAEELDARVIDENGQEFAGRGTVLDEGAAQPARGARARVLLNRERVRRRQILLFLPLCLVYPALVVYWAMTGEVGIAHYLFAALSLGFGAYVARGLFGARFFVLRDPLASRWLVHDLDSRTTADEVVVSELRHRDLPALELVWFVLDYPARRKIQFHVRGVGQPDLVLLETGSEGRARKCLREAGSALHLRTEDRTDGAPAKDVPKSYQLTAAEKKAAPMKGQVIVLVVLLAVATGLFFAGARIAAYVIAGITALVAVGNIAGRALPDAIPQKYRDRC